MGALTFFLPCGFTITAQSLALLSGSVFTGALIMGAFALGTIPVLLFIGLSSVKFSSKPHLTERFSKVAGFLVLFFALYNISNQATVLGFTGININQNIDCVNKIKDCFNVGYNPLMAIKFITGNKNKFIFETYYGAAGALNFRSGRVDCKTQVFGPQKSCFAGRACQFYTDDSPDITIILAFL